MRLLDRLMDRYRDQGFYEGMASGAAVYMTYGSDANREIPAQNLEAAARQAFSTNGVVFAISQIRMMLLAEATFKYRNKVDKSLYGNEGLRILEYPWPNATSGDLLARMSQDIDLAGNAFIAKIADDQLLRLPPSEVTIVSQKTRDSQGRTFRQVIGYDWDPKVNTAQRQQRDPQAQFFTVDEVAHWAQYPDPLANFRGMSWLTPIIREITADSGMTAYKNQYLDHGTPVISVKYPAQLRPETIDALVERLQVKYGGVDNAFKPLVFDQGADPTLGSTLADLDFSVVQAAGAARICSAGGVDPLVLGLPTPRQAGVAYQEAMRRLADGTLRPLWRGACAALEKFVQLPPKGVELWFDTSDIAALQAAETERAQVTQVNAAAVLTLRQAQATFDSAVSAVSSGDLTQLVFDPTAPAPGQKQGSPPGGGQVLTQAQTPASKEPMPDSIPDSKVLQSASAKNPSLNGHG